MVMVVVGTISSPDSIGARSPEVEPFHNLPSWSFYTVDGDVGFRNQITWTWALPRLTPLNWNPHSLLQISPTSTLVPSTQLALVYSSYVYPPSSEERDSRMDGFKLDIFNKEAGINRVTGELLLPDWLGTKSCLYLIHSQEEEDQVKVCGSSPSGSTDASRSSASLPLIEAW